MKTNWKFISCLFLAAFITVSACEFFTNKPGVEEEPLGEVDIAIAHVDAPLSVKYGEEIDLHIILQNNGEQNVDKEITIQLVEQPSDSLITKYLVTEEIPADSTIEVNLNLNSSLLNFNSQGIRISHNFNDKNPDNDSRFVNLTISDGQQTDLAITSMSAPSELMVGDEAEINVTLTNMGSETIESGTILELFKQNEENIIANQVLDEDLDSSASRSFVFNWNTRNEDAGEYEIIARHTFEDTTPQNNEGAVSISLVSTEPVDGLDLAITSIDAPSEAGQDEAVDITIRIKNAGNDVINNDIEFVLFDETYDTQIDVIVFDEELNTGESSDLTFTWNTENAAGGSHTLIAYHDFEDSNTQNNVRSTQIEIDAPAFKDVAITDVGGPSSIDQGDEVELSFTVTNTGQVEIKDEVINIEIVDETDGIQIGNQQFEENLEINESRTIEISWNTEASTAGQHSIVVSHDLNDSDGSNNVNDLQIQVDEPNPDFSITSFSPNEMQKNSEERFTITGTGFTEGIEVDFFRKQDDDGDNDDDDDDDDDDDENPPEPIITELAVLNEELMEMSVYAWWWGPKRANWSVRFEHPNESVIELNNAIKIR